MNDKTVTINSNFDYIKESNKTWQPVRNGKTFLKYLDSNKKISEKNLVNLIKKRAIKISFQIKL